MNTIKLAMPNCWLLLISLLLVACGGDGESLTCAERITTPRQVSEYSVDGQPQSTQGVRASFSGNNYTLEVPEIDEFGTAGSWEVTNDCSSITLNDTNRSIVVDVAFSPEDDMTLSFSYANFKDRMVRYQIVLASGN